MLLLSGKRLQSSWVPQVLIVCLWLLSFSAQAGICVWLLGGKKPAQVKFADRAWSGESEIGKEFYFVPAEQSWDARDNGQAYFRTDNGGYQPDAIAKALRSEKVGRLGFLISNKKSEDGFSRELTFLTSEGKTYQFSAYHTQYWSVGVALLPTGRTLQKVLGSGVRK